MGTKMPYLVIVGGRNLKRFRPIGNQHPQIYEIDKIRKKIA